MTMNTPSPPTETFSSGTEQIDASSPPPPPHRDLTRKEATTLRQIQAQAIWTPVLARHICPAVYTTDICQQCQQARATQRHLLWNCAPPDRLDEAMPPAMRSKITSQDPGDQRDVVQHVLDILARQQPKTSPSRVGMSGLPPQAV
ncbi:hypothetical protein HPB48_003257 [Haemaphysalis longicornis]|uniref:Uncharacterized protein n=1 Tax=Haemaphysalis longicornis TaxID=44386 RepID=A0A9J6H3R5_HAELO|nr:hypothetical protein HPB48_003257 [Haemaphysalis longicornis]